MESAGLSGVDTEVCAHQLGGRGRGTGEQRVVGGERSSTHAAVGEYKQTWRKCNPNISVRVRGYF